MKKQQKELLKEIDETIKHLEEHARLLDSPSLFLLGDVELEALKRTEESLLARLIDRDQCLKAGVNKGIVQSKSVLKRTLEKKLLSLHPKKKKNS